MSKKPTPFLWFDHQAEDAAKFYTSVFPNSRITQTARYSEGMPGKAGSVMTVAFELDGQVFTALNGGPHFTHSPAVSFVVDCDNQQEVDYFWDALVAGGAPSQCGWLTDKFGLSWQIVPTVLPSLIAGPDAEGAKRAAGAMMKMVKLDIATLQRAYDGK
jgi:predicted 3-demethylubiquinone-9 3-methyltransferase (glyoxalase superfamily)